MNLEQIYNELFLFWQNYQGEKGRWGDVFYRDGGIKDIIEKELLKMEVKNGINQV